MPTLEKLNPETIEALGSLKNLKERYEDLSKLSGDKSIIDHKDARGYVDDVIRRYSTIKALSPKNEELQQKKQAYLGHLRKHVAEVSVASFSKPGDIENRLIAVEVAPDKAAQIVKQVQQGGGGDDLASLISSTVTSETSLISASGSGSHHHHHHHGHHHHGHGHGHR